MRSIPFDHRLALDPLIGRRARLRARRDPLRGPVEAGKRIAVIADETLPFLQGARLTVWEMQQEGIPVTLITDGMAGHLMQRGEVDAVIVGADRERGGVAPSPAPPNNGSTGSRYLTSGCAGISRPAAVRHRPFIALLLSPPYGYDERFVTIEVESMEARRIFSPLRL